MASRFNGVRLKIPLLPLLLKTSFISSIKNTPITLSAVIYVVRKDTSSNSRLLEQRVICPGKHTLTWWLYCQQHYIKYRSNTIYLIITELLPRKRELKQTFNLVKNCGFKAIYSLYNMCFGSNRLENNITNYLKMKKHTFLNWNSDHQQMYPFITHIKC